MHVHHMYMHVHHLCMYVCVGGRVINFISHNQLIKYLKYITCTITCMSDKCRYLCVEFISCNCAHVQQRVHVHVHVHVHVQQRAHVHVCMCACVHVHVCTRVSNHIWLSLVFVRWC